MVISGRQLQEKCKEQSTYLFSTYINQTKTFDTVSKEDL